MTRVQIYQIDAEALLLANTSLLSALLQDLVLSVTASAAAPFYRKGWTIDVDAAGEAALEKAWFVAQEVADFDATVIEKAPTARMSAKSDLFILDDGTAWIAQGSWFASYEGPRPAGATSTPTARSIVTPALA